MRPRGSRRARPLPRPTAKRWARPPGRADTAVRRGTVRRRAGQRSETSTPLRTRKGGGANARQPLASPHRDTCARKPAEQASPAPVHSCARERRLDFTPARLANVARARRVDKRLHRRRRHLPPLAAPPSEDTAPAGLLRGGGVGRRRSRRRERRAPADLDHHQGGDISPYLPTSPHISPYLPTLTTTKVEISPHISPHLPTSPHISRP